MFGFLKCKEKLLILAILKAICLATLRAQDLNTECVSVNNDVESDLIQTFDSK